MRDLIEQALAEELLPGVPSSRALTVARATFLPVIWKKLVDERAQRVSLETELEANK